VIKIYYLDVLSASKGTLSLTTGTNAPAAFAVVTTHSSFKLTSGRRPVVKIVVESLSQQYEKHVVSYLVGIRVGKRGILKKIKQMQAVHIKKPFK
jgi:hypothetical protein